MKRYNYWKDLVWIVCPHAQTSIKSLPSNPVHKQNFTDSRIPESTNTCFQVKKHHHNYWLDQDKHTFPMEIRAASKAFHLFSQWKDVQLPHSQLRAEIKYCLIPAGRWHKAKFNSNLCVMLNFVGYCKNTSSSWHCNFSLVVQLLHFKILTRLPAFYCHWWHFLSCN